MAGQLGAEGAASGGGRQALHDATIAAVTVGSGLGVHFAGSQAPFVASASVLAAALVSRHHYGGQLEHVRGEVRLVQAQLEALKQQVQSDRESDLNRLSWVANISHEIRSPLSAVVALGDLLADQAEDAAQKALVRDIREAGQMVLDVVNDTLDLAKAESGRLRLLSRPLSLSALCHRVGRLGQTLTPHTSRIEVAVSPLAPDRVLGDELRLQQVLLNLVSNAAKYGDGGRIDIACEGVETSDDGLYLVCFRIRDRGPGLGAEDQQRLFKPYSRTDGADQGPQGGTGLGLYLCERLVHLMGGTIGVRSQPGAGSEFWFTVPLRRAVAPQGPAADPIDGVQALAASPRLHGRTIAVVDDARMSREVARRIIESTGGTCLLYVSGEHFLEQLQAQLPAIDLVILDLEMPGIDGFETCRRLRGLRGGAEMPVIAVSGSEAETASLNGSGLDGHLLKPFHADTLVDAILAHLV